MMLGLQKLVAEIQRQTAFSARIFHAAAMCTVKTNILLQLPMYVTNRLHKATSSSATFQHIIQ